MAMPHLGMSDLSRERPARRRGAASPTVIAIAAAMILVGGSIRRAAAAVPFWERAAEPTRSRMDRLTAEADMLLASQPRSPEKLARAEGLIRDALASAPDDFRALMLLAELSVRAGRPAEALAALERACPRAPQGAGATACWFQLGVERSRQGRLGEAVLAYERLIALGDADATTHANLAELLMAEGRLVEATARYREAIRLETPAAGAARIEPPHSLTLATYGLAVALDRAGQAEAAREMMARALLLDPKHATLTAAEQPGADVFFVPDGDVYYYLGLAAEVAGDSDGGAAAFQEFLRRRPRAASAGRARAHLDALLADAGVAPRAGRSPSLRVAAVGTVRADGPIPAPLVDAAWRAAPHMLDACLADAVSTGALAPREGVRLAIELAFDERGAVAEASVKAPAAIDASFARCAESAVKGGLRVPSPRRARPSRARLELLIAPADAGGV
jgi:tetratricopeptide (TPR) repeat protein